jgi:class 3 adenylate cyclase
MAVHIAARIMAEADPAAIACSQTVKDLVVGSRLEFAPLGTRDLKRIPGDWSLYSVRSP